MNETTIYVTDWHKTPKFRFRTEYDYCGQAYREDILVPALNKFDHVHVNLTGYNRYGPSFIDEAFANLIRVSGFTPQQIENKLTYSHDILKRVELQIQDKIQNAINEYNLNKIAK